LYQGGLRPEVHRALLLEVRRCRSCARFYQEQDRLESALGGGLGSRSTGVRNGHLVLARLEPLVLARVAAPPARSPWRRIGAWIWIPAATLAAMLWLVLPTATSQVVALDPQARLAQVGIVARGAPRAESTEVGVRLLRVVPEGGTVEPTASLSLDDVVTFVYTSLEPRMRYLAVFGIQEGGDIRWYYPGSSEQASIPIAGAVVDQPLRDGIRLSVFHRPGWLRVTAIFSTRPIDKKDLEAAVRSLASRSTALQGLESLPLDAPETLETTFMVQIGQSGQRSQTVGEQRRP
jgi:hypothetical protein